MCFSKALCLPWIQPSTVQTPQYKTQDTRAFVMGTTLHSYLLFVVTTSPTTKKKNLEKHTLHALYKQAF
jgi:hypothetical protein